MGSEGIGTVTGPRPPRPSGFDPGGGAAAPRLLPHGPTQTPDLLAGGARLARRRRSTRSTRAASPDSNGDGDRRSSRDPRPSRSRRAPRTLPVEGHLAVHRSTRRPGADSRVRPVTDHTAVRPRLLGTERPTFDRLVARLPRARKSRVILDLVDEPTPADEERPGFSPRRHPAKGPVRRLLSVGGNPRGLRRRWQPDPAEQLGPRSSAARAGNGFPTGSSSTTTRFPRRPAELNWRNPAVEAAQWEHGPGAGWRAAASTASGSTSSTPSSRTPTCATTR